MSKPDDGDQSEYYQPGESLTDWSVFEVDDSIGVSDLVDQWFGKETDELQETDVSDTKYMDIIASSWSQKVKINRVSKASGQGDVLTGKQKSSSSSEIEGSLLCGGDGSDRIQGKAGWDFADGGAGDDLVKTGNGRDILTGGLGEDELWGGFGWNTYRGDKDGFADLLVIKSDQHLLNPMLGKAANNADGSKCDIIEDLDRIDQIVIQGVNISDLSFQGNINAQGIKGVAIYAKGVIEALYTGSDLTVSDITAMTSGDASDAAINNTLSSYWF